MQGLINRVIFTCVAVLLCSGLLGCSKAGSIVHPEFNPLPGNPNPGVVRVTLDLPFSQPKSEIEITAGLCPIQPDGDGYLVEVKPGYSQIVWATSQGDLLGIVVIIDSASVAEVRIDAKSTIMAILFLAPNIAQGDLEYDLKTWQLINSAPHLTELADELGNIMVHSDSGYFADLSKDENFKSKFAAVLNYVLSSDPVREANGNKVDPNGKIKGLELRDEHTTPDQNDLAVYNYYPRYAKVVYPTKDEESEMWVEPGTSSKPSSAVITVDYKGQAQSWVKAYTIGKDLDKLNANDVPHVIDVFMRDVVCRAGKIVLKSIGVGEMTDGICSCGQQALEDYYNKHNDKRENIEKLLTKDPLQPLKAIEDATIDYGHALVDDLDIHGMSSCIGTAFIDMGPELIREKLMTYLFKEVEEVYSFLEAIQAVKDFADSFNNGQVKTKWIIGFNNSPIIQWHDPVVVEQVPYKIYLSATGSYDPDGTSLIYKWDMGNGEIVEGETAYYTYYAPGLYRCQLTLTDGDNVKAACDFKVDFKKPIGYYPSALYLGGDKTVKQLIEQAGFKTNMDDYLLPESYDYYDVIVLDTSLTDQNSAADIIKTFLDYGNKGVVLIGATPYYLDSNDSDDKKICTPQGYELTKIQSWCGACNIRSDPFPTAACAAVENPLGTSIPKGDTLYSQAWTAKIGMKANTLKPGAGFLGFWYPNGDYFAYTYPYANSRVYYQSTSGDSQNPNAQTLFKAGVAWSGTTALADPCKPDGNDFWNEGYECSFGNVKSGSVCWSGDKEDWYWFHSDGLLSGTLDLEVTNKTGQTRMVLISGDDAVNYPNSPYSGWAEASGPDYTAQIVLTDKGLIASGYFIVIQHYGNDLAYREYTLKNNGQSSGNAWLLWGGNWSGVTQVSYDPANDIALDTYGNAYVTGYFRGTVDFNPSQLTDNHTSNGDEDAFLSKFGSDGALQWARTWGGGGADEGNGVASDSSGNVYVTGGFTGTVDFDPGQNECEAIVGSCHYAYLSKFDMAGNFQWVRTWGEGKGNEVVVDKSDNVYITGRFKGTADLDPGISEDYHSASGVFDAFVMKLSPDGEYRWVRTWGGNDYCAGRDMAVDGEGNVCIMGLYTGTADFAPGPETEWHTSNGWIDVSLSKFSPDGDLMWARTMGGADQDEGWGIAADNSGNIYATGRFKGSVDWDPGPQTDIRTSKGKYDAFLVKLNTNGDYQWARTWGSPNNESGNGIAVDAECNVYITDRFAYSVDFDPGPGIDIHKSNGQTDICLSKFNSYGDYIWALTWGGPNSDGGRYIAVDECGSIFITGDFRGTADFDPGPGTDLHTANNNDDVFLIKLSQ